MENINLVTYGRLSQELSDYIEEIKDPNISCTVVSNEDELHDRINEFNSFAGFELPKTIDASHLIWAHSFGAGVDKILWNKSINSNCFITKTLGEMNYKIAEYCLTYLLLHFKTAIEFYQSQSIHSWDPTPTRELRGSSVLILGTGFIGREIAKVLKIHQMKTIGINTSGHPAPHFDESYKTVDSVKVQHIDAIINVMPLTEKTRNYYDSTFFKKFNTVLFINVGRGESVVDHDLLDAVNNGNVSKAVLDVFRQEPLPLDHKFWNNSKILMTPHIAAKTTMDDMKNSFKIALVEYKSNTSDSRFIVKLKRGY